MQKRTFARASMVLLFLSSTFAQPEGIESTYIKGLLETKVISHQGYRFGEALFQELMNPNLFPLDTWVNQNHGVNQDFQTRIAYIPLGNQDSNQNAESLYWSLPIFLDQLVEIQLTTPVPILENPPNYQIGIPLETPEVFWPSIDQLNTSNTLLFIPTMGIAWEKLTLGQISSIVTSAQSLVSWLLTQDCQELEPHQITMQGSTVRGHFASTQSQLIAQINLGLRILGANNRIEELGNQYFTTFLSTCSQQIPFDFFLRY